MSQDQDIANVTVIWIGRFLHKGGYGVATRAIFSALKESGIDVLGIDSSTGKPIEDLVDPNISIDIDPAGELCVTANEKGHKFVVIVHETPLSWGRYEVSGKTHLAGYTVTESEQIPFGWRPNMHSVDRLFTATEFNANVFAAADIPASMIHVLPHVADSNTYTPRKKISDFDAGNKFRFLHVVSNFNRKDTGGLVAAYCSAFCGSDDVSLVIKVPEYVGLEKLKASILDAAFPWMSANSNNLPHILLIQETFSEEQMAELYKAAHVYVSFERGKGWDLPAMEAMLSAVPTVGLNWGANTTFQTKQNSILIDPHPHTIFAAQDLVENKELYTGHTWATYDLSDAAIALRDAYDNFDQHQIKANQTAVEISGKYSEKSISDNFLQYVRSLEDFEFSNNEVAKLTIRKTDNLSPTKKSSFEKLPENVRQDLNILYTPDQDVDTWVKRRRTIWGKYGPVLPEQREIDKVRQLRNKYAGESIFIIGNGPSLKKVDMEKLSAYYTFATNRIYLLFDKTTWRPDFYTTLDWRVTPDNYNDINQLSGMTMFFPHRFRGLLREGEDVFWYESLSPGKSLFEQFEANMTHGVRGGGTVLTAAIQMAHYLGFSNMFLIGVDVSYSIPNTVKQSGGDRFGTGVQINLESTRDDDINHFDPRYFGKGAVWHDPNVNAMKRGFRSSYRALDVLGKNLYNSTEGGNLDCVRRLSLSEALKFAKPKT